MDGSLRWVFLSSCRSILVAIAVAAVVLAVPGRSYALQEVGPLIEKLASADPTEAEKTRDALLARGGQVIVPLRKAIAESGDGRFRRRATAIVERLEVRMAAADLSTKWGDRWYAIRAEGHNHGWLRLKLQEIDGRFLLTDEFYVGDTQSMHMRNVLSVTAKIDDFLTIEQFSWIAERKNKEESFEIRAHVSGDKMVVTRNTFEKEEGEGEGEQEAPPNLTTDLAVMRLVTLLPESRGYPISVLSTFQKPKLLHAVIRFDGHETLWHGGRRIKTRRFKMSDPETADRTYWVSEKGELLKVHLYGKVELVLTNEKQAKDIDQPPEIDERPDLATLRRMRPPDEKIPAFPGAEGFGTRTRAGRGGKVIEVTSLADSGPGTLREALVDPSPRIIVFRVGGTVNLKESLYVSSPFVTVAGQTAPGGGITIKNEGIAITSHDVLIQHIRVRPGNKGRGDPENNDAVAVLGPQGEIDGAYNVVLDHISASWGEDETVSTWFGASDITISSCLISEALDKSRHPKGRHGAGLLIGDRSDRVTVHHTVLAHNDFRNPLISESGTVDFVGNVIYNWGRTCGQVTATEGIQTRINLVGNVFLAGPSSPPGMYELVVDQNLADQGQRLKIHAKDNRGPHRRGFEVDEFTLVSVGWDGKPLPRECRSVQQIQAPAVTRIHDMAKVLSRAGATVPERDEVDERVIRDIRKKTGRMINSPEEVGGYTPATSGQPPADSDHDGMPDEWELATGLDPKNAADGKADRDGDGYTNIEEYLHSFTMPDSP